MRAAVSVLIPSLGGGHRLVELVERLRSEGTGPTELLIADNGMPAETVEALATHRRRAARRAWLRRGTAQATRA